MSERPATRADLRAAVWQTIRRSHAPAVGNDALTGAVGLVWALRMLAALDAEEAGDVGATRRVTRYLSGVIVETNPAGAVVAVRRARQDVTT